MSKDLGASRIAAETREGFVPPPRERPETDHGRYLESLSALCGYLAAWTADKSARVGETAQAIAKRLVALADHAQGGCALCASQEARGVEKLFLKLQRPYFSSAHGRSASSLENVLVDAPGKDEADMDERYPYRELAEALAKKWPPS